jgi:photosynthetic reaction center cytochrome c subunit
MMMPRLNLLTIAAGACACIVGCQRVPPGPAVQPAAVQPLPQAVDTVSEANARTAQSVLLRIAGREDMPAESVFKNVKFLNRVPARTFLTIMNIGYARALGVKCSYCHVEEDFSSDEKRPKRAAREMAAMHRMINQELAKMQYISIPPTENRSINCSTCHRGTVNPIKASR